MDQNIIDKLEDFLKILRKDLKSQKISAELFLRLVLVIKIYQVAQKVEAIGFILKNQEQPIQILKYFAENHDNENFLIEEEVLSQTIQILRKIKVFKRDKEQVKKNIVVGQSEKIRKFLCDQITLNRLL